MQTMSHATAINTIFLSEYIEVKCVNPQQHKANFPLSRKTVTRMTTGNKSRHELTKAYFVPSTIQNNKYKV
jgi:hypothetical protein